MHITPSEKSQSSLQESNQVESNDSKYASEFSTLLVATIQEAKDRISQIEYIFCSQLYPNIQTSTKILQKVYSEARIAAECEWKERQCELELQLKQICLEKELALDECKAFKVEKLRLLTKVAELEDKLLRKEKEVDDGMDLHAKLLGLLEEKTVILRDKDWLMKEREEEMKLMVSKSEEYEGKIDVLNKELQEKNEEVTKLTKDLQRQIESQEVKIMNTELMLCKSEEEKKQLSKKMENVEASLDGLRNELRRKIAEADEQKLFHEKEKQELVSKVNHLQSKIEKLQGCPRNANAGRIGIKEPLNGLAKQSELKASELAAEKLKLGEHVAYKRLLSQQLYLLKKFGLSKEDLLLQMKAEEESDSLNNGETTLKLPETKKRTPVSNVVECELNKVKREINTMESSDDENIVRLNQISKPKSPSGSESPAATHWTTSRKTRNLGSVAGGKRPVSGWRETRSHQSPGGPDPHDDFLDTPYEDIRGNFHVKDSLRDIPAQIPKDVDSDAETQDLKAESAPKRQQLQAPRSSDGPKGFKYVEPVRKKAERENLNGVECKQCKKFYDAVLCDAGPKNGEADKHNFRCEHHDGVSRHRYRYAPPLTPEGFWNIGFDTES